MKEPGMKRDLTQRLLGVQLVVFDVDGVLTDGRIFKSESGEEWLAFQVRDGMGITRLKQEGIEVAVLSGRTSGAMMARAKELGLEMIHMGKTDKAPAIESIAQEAQVDLSSIAFVGDDLLDISAMEKVGLAVAVADAAEDVKNVAHLVLDTPGGMGAARELAEKILKAKGRWIT